MRKYLLGAAAALAIATPAAAQTSGYVDAGYQSTDAGDEGEFEATHLGAAVHHRFDNGWGIQADGRTVDQSWEGSSTDLGVGYAAIHGYYALSEHWDLGAYYGHLTIEGRSGTLIGIESRKQIGNLSLQASVGSLEQDPFYEAQDYRIGANWFFTPNFGVNAGIGRTEVDYESGFDSESDDWSVGAAFQFANGIGVYGTYGASSVDWVTFDYDTETVRLGLRWNFNGGDLQTVTNEGASWNGAAAFHEFFVRYND